MLGIDGRYSKTVQKHCCALAAETSFAASSVQLQEMLGVEMPAETVRTVVEGHGQAMARFQSEDTQTAAAFAKAKGEVEFAVDAGKVNTREEGWKDLKIAVISKREAGEPTTVEQYRSQRLPAATMVIAFAMIATAKTFRRSWRKRLRRVGVTCWAGVQALGDGAAWIWKSVERALTGCTQTLDFYHACEHLHACAEGIWRRRQRVADGLRTRPRLVARERLGGHLPMDQRTADGRSGSRAGTKASLDGQADRLFCQARRTAQLRRAFGGGTSDWQRRGRGASENAGAAAEASGTFGSKTSLGPFSVSPAWRPWTRCNGRDGSFSMPALPAQRLRTALSADSSPESILFGPLRPRSRGAGGVGRPAGLGGPAQGKACRREQAQRYRRRIPLVVLPESLFTAGPAEPERSPESPALSAPAEASVLPAPEAPEAARASAQR